MNAVAAPNDASPDELQVAHLHTIAREFADLKPWQTLQITPQGRYLERRFRVARDAGVIARTLAPYDPSKHRITCTRFHSDKDDVVVLHVVEIGAPDSPLESSSPTQRAVARR